MYVFFKFCKFFSFFLFNDSRFSLQGFVVAEDATIDVAFSFAMLLVLLECLFILAMMPLLVLSHYLKILVYWSCIGGVPLSMVTFVVIFVD